MLSLLKIIKFGIQVFQGIQSGRKRARRETDGIPGPGALILLIFFLADCQFVVELLVLFFYAHEYLMVFIEQSSEQERRESEVAVYFDAPF